MDFRQPGLYSEDTLGESAEHFTGKSSPIETLLILSIRQERLVGNDHWFEPDLWTRITEPTAQGSALPNAAYTDSAFFKL